MTMTMTRFDPFRELTNLQQRMNRAFGDVYLRDEDVTNRGTWIPPVDIFETDAHDLVLRAELPDVAREDIEVTVENSVLRLKGQKKGAMDVREEQYHRIERSYGAFSRSFTLPATVDGSKVSAEYRNGVLTITLPFKEEAKPRTIAVNVSA